jgi:alpha-beta hydrolase superfamily lysophospholipase
MKISKLPSFLLFTLLLAASPSQASKYFSKLRIEDAVDVQSAKELRGIGPHLVEINSPRFGFYNDITLRAHYFKAENPKALVLAAHGMQSNARWFLQTGTFLAQNGISVLAYDRRGSGLSDGNPQRLSLANFPSIDLDPNSDEIKLAPGLRGHNDTGLIVKRLLPIATKQFLRDMKVSYEKLIELNKDYKKPDGRLLDIHILANCFGSRIALPFAHSLENAGVFSSGNRLRSLIITAPATDMRPEADVTSLYQKIRVLTPGIPFIDNYSYIKTPLSDELFVPRSHPAYREIQDDSTSLSLRYVTNDFLWGTMGLINKMNSSFSKINTPVLAALASKDKMVFNDRIKNRFKSQYGAPGKVLTFEASHMIEFEPAGAGFLEAVKLWINQEDSQRRSSNNTNFRGLKGLLSQDNIPGISAAVKKANNDKKRKLRASVFPQR